MQALALQAGPPRRTETSLVRSVGVEDTSGIETRESTDDRAEGNSDRDASALLDAFRSGDVEAGYELLGRGATVKEVLSGLTLRAPDVSLERVVGSTLRRSSEVVVAVIELAERTATPEAVLVLRAIEELRDDASVVERAARAKAELQERYEARLEDPESADGRELLHLVLARPIARQKELFALWREAAPSAARAVEEAVRTEDERLQQLAKERSYKAGSYLHFLRHALADFVLVSGLGGSLGRRAFALLQRRVEAVDREEALLEVLPDDVRTRYLQWTLDVKNADAIPRTRFALRMVQERFPELADRATLLALIQRGAPEVALEAARTCLRLDIREAPLDREITHLLDRLAPELARELVRELREAPGHVRLAELTPEDRGLLFDAETPAAAGFASALVEQLPLLQSRREVLAILSGLERTELEAEDEEQAFDAAAALVVASTSFGSGELASVLEGTRLRAAVWRLLPRVDGGRRAEILEALLEAEDANERAGLALKALAASEPEPREAFAATLVDGVTCGLLDPHEAAEHWPDDLRALALERAEEIRVEAEAEHAELLRSLEHGEAEYLRDVHASIKPLVERAQTRARGNQRLEEGYSRLLGALSSAEASGAKTEREARQPRHLASELPAQVQKELESVGGSIEVADPPRLALEASSDSAAARVRYLGVLDQRVSTAGTAADLRRTSEALLPAYVRALAQTELVSSVLTNLFEGGPYLPLLVQLSAGTRELLVREAVANGFQPPAQWFDHPALGAWLRGLVGSPPGSAAAETASPDGLATGFRRAVEACEARVSAREALARQRQAVVAELARAASSVFDEIDALIDSYAQLWHGLSRIGMRQIAPLGVVLERDDVDSELHEVVGEPDRSRFVVRSPGLEVEGMVIARARVEGVD